MKRGVTVTILAVTIAVMAIIVSTTAVVGTKAIQTAAYEEFMSKVVRVMNDVNDYVIENNELPTTMEIVAKEGLNTRLLNEITKKGDSNNSLYVIDMNKLRTESVNIGFGTVENLDVFLVAENTNNVYYLKGITYKGNEYYSVIAEVNETVPKGWSENVTALVDTVPIPKGFVVSPYNGENTRDNGLVIYELKTNETSIPSSETHHTSLTTRNQYVWIPIDDFSKFVRQNFGLGSVISNTLGTNYWEVVPTTDETTDNNKKYLVQGTTLTEVQAMYASVEEYGGFYIARYEAGIDKQRTSKGDDPTALPSTLANVHSKMGKIPYTYIPWTWNDAMNEEANGAVSVARSLYPNDSNTTGVVSTLTYGVQWDAAVEWLRTNGKDINGNAIESVTNSIAYGNYEDHEIKAGDLNEGAQYAIYSTSTYTLGTFGDVTYATDGSSTNTKNTSTAWALSTGALKAANVNNIYDMAGNMHEWTMEGYSSLYRVLRGGDFVYDGDGDPLAVRHGDSPSLAYDYIGFRLSLYIKK